MTNGLGHHNTPANISNEGEDTFWGHFTAGIFLSGYGCFFLALTMVRFRRIHVSDGVGLDLEQSLSCPPSPSNDRSGSGSSTVHTFLERHNPEQSSSVLYATSLSLIASTVFGLLYEGLGARFLHRDLHPDYTVFHYVTHLTLTLLYMFAGWTGLWEVWGYLPRDSLRGSIVFALTGEVLLWYDHALNKSNVVDAAIHTYLAVISAFTAVVMSMSMMMSNGHGATSMFVYVGGFVGLYWQGLWFCVAAVHQVRPFSSTSRVTICFVLQAMALVLTIQIASFCMLGKIRSNSNNNSSNNTTKEEEYTRISNHDDDTNKIK